MKSKSFIDNKGFTDSVLKILLQKYGFDFSIEQCVSVDNPYGFYKLGWFNHSKLYTIEIEQTAIGPARIHDFVVETHKKIVAEYPELII